MIGEIEGEEDLTFFYLPLYFKNTANFKLEY